MKALQGHRVRHYRGTDLVMALQGHKLSEGTSGTPTEWRHYRSTNCVKALQGRHRCIEGTAEAPTHQLQQLPQPGVLRDTGNQPHVHRLVVQDFWNVTPYSLADGYQHFWKTFYRQLQGIRVMVIYIPSILIHFTPNKWHRNVMLK